MLKALRVLAAIGLGVALGGALMLVYKVYSWRNDDTLASGLQYVTIRQFLAGETDVEALAVYDEGPRNAAPQWYLITAPTDAYEAQIGFPNVRLFEAMLGRHLTIYCSSHGVAQGKLVWALRGGDVVKARVYCSRKRMDISQLIPLSRLAEEVDRSDLTAAAYTALKARVDANPDAVVTHASTLSPYSHTCGATFPYLWQPDEPEVPWLPNQLEDAIGALVAEFAPKGSYDLSFEGASATDYVYSAVEGEDAAQALPPETRFFRLERDGETRKVPGLRLFRPTVTLKADAATCARFDSLDVLPVWQGLRERGQLDRAWARGVVLGASDNVPPFSQSELETSQMTREKTRPITYRLRYLQAQP